MRHPLRENLEIARPASGTDWICCSRCRFRYCGADQNWRKFCKIRLLPPSNAGSLMSALDGQYLCGNFIAPRAPRCWILTL